MVMASSLVSRLIFRVAKSCRKQTLLSGFALVLGTFWAISPAQAAPIVIDSEIIPYFDRLQPDKMIFGKLEWVGGLVLTSPKQSDFGGISGFSWIGPQRFLAVTDQGNAISGELVTAQGQPVGIRDAALELLPGLRTKKAKWRRDAEGLDAKGAMAWVSFEGASRLVPYKLSGGRPKTALKDVKLPKALRKASRGNAGLEAVALAPDSSPLAGGLVLMSERAKGGNIQGWILRKGRTKRFVLPQSGKLRVTDAAFLANGDLLILERDFSLLRGLTIQLRRIASGDLRAGAITRFETLFKGDLRYELDNLEGLAVQSLADGSSLLTMVSDDNFNMLQRTVLLQFRLSAN